MIRASLVAALLLVGAAGATALGQDLPAESGGGADSPAQRARIRAAAAEAGSAPPPMPGMGGDADAPSGSALDTPVGARPAVPGAPGVPGGPAPSVDAADRDTIVDPTAPTLVQVLKERAAKLAARKAELDQEEARLKALRADIAARFVELSALRDALDERMVEFSSELDARRDVQLNKLVKAMQGMPPEAAADMAVEMDEGVVVRAFDRMKARSVAKVLAAMPPPTAARVGQRLALFRKGLGGGKKEADR